MGLILANEQTLAGKARCSGIGIHSGLPATVTLCSAPPGTGIRFKRTDVTHGIDEIPAEIERVSGVALATKLSSEDHCVGTVEHLLAALHGLGVDNALIEIDGPEVPIMDGSALEFCSAIRSVGLVRQSSSRKILRILNTIEVGTSEKWARLSPRLGNSLELRAKIEFADDVIGAQEASFCLEKDDFESDLATARTFGFAWEVDDLKQRGFARGGSLENAIVIDKNGVANPEGLRFADEFVRHKLLDAIGDLYLVGARIAGRYEANQPGHKLNYELVSALLAQPDAWCIDFETDENAMPVELAGGSHIGAAV
ncbi:MAG: UDP-3-O-acyl-N-acetylglucosamine deacetylase [Pseudomonadota bacterium]